jgi:hypothetical protein
MPMSDERVSQSEDHESLRQTREVLMPTKRKAESILSKYSLKKSCILESIEQQQQQQQQNE